MTKVRNASLGITLLASVAMVPTTGFAWKATAAQQAACMSDVFRLCASYVPNEDSVARCLASKKPQLSPGCLATVKKAGL
jgi:hypothetical protein